MAGEEDVSTGMPWPLDGQARSVQGITQKQSGALSTCLPSATQAPSGPAPMVLDQSTDPFWTSRLKTKPRPTCMPGSQSEADWQQLRAKAPGEGGRGMAQHPLQLGGMNGPSVSL